MCFGGSDSSDKMIRMQEKEAAAARVKEGERQNRLASGLARIRMAFEGQPIMGTRRVTGGYDFGRGGAGLPAGYRFVAATPGTPASTSGGYVNRVGGDHGRYYSSTANQTAATPGSAAYIIGPDGRRYNPGDKFAYDEQYDTGQNSGGFGEDFFNKFKQGIVDYYMPQVAEQYGEAKDETTFGLARHGLGRSSVASDKFADLKKQNEIQEGNVRAKADTGAADLRGRVASERAKAESQLYATENPDVAANQATAAVTNLNAAQPDLSPLAEVFKIAALGGAGIGSGYRNAEYMKKYGLNNTGGYGATRTVGT